MIQFEHNNIKYITINGKSFYLIRGFIQNRGNFIFIQVIGNYQLFIEDLPDTKKWKLIKTKTQDLIIYTAYNSEYHNYQGDRLKGKLLFPAPTSKGSFFLLLKYVNEKYGFKLTDKDLLCIPEDLRGGLIVKEIDQGNSDTGAYMLNIYEGAEKELQEIILKNKE
ncbi:MAG: hypothetical protein ABIA63_02335 [bacterium]